MRGIPSIICANHGSKWIRLSRAPQPRWLSSSAISPFIRSPFSSDDPAISWESIIYSERRQHTKIAHFLVATLGLDSCFLSHALVRFVLELLLDRSRLCRSCLLGGSLLGGSRLCLLGHP